jgi:hypothetical protein
MEGTVGLADEIARTRGLPVKVVGGLSLIAADDAEVFLVECQRQRVRVLGVEGVRLQRGATVPDMSTIADFSELGSEPAARSVRQARRFVRELRSPGLLFDFTLERETRAQG